MKTGPQRVHSSYVWLGGLKGFLITLVAVGFSLAGSLIPICIEFAVTGEVLGMSGLAVLLVMVLGVVALFAVAALFALLYWLAWKNLTYEVTSEEFNLKSGIFSKKNQHVPYQRVQSVDIRASLLQRVAGVCSVEIDTAGGSSNKAIVVPYLTKSAADELRSELFRRKRIIMAGGNIAEDGSAVVPGGGVRQPAPSVAAGASSASNVLDDVSGLFADSRGVFDQGGFVEEEPASFETGLSNMELLLSGLSDIKNVAGAIFLGFLGLFAMLCSVDLFSTALGNWVESALEADQYAGMAVGVVANKLALQILPPLLLAFAASFVIVSGVSAIAAVVSFGGFKVRRRGTRVEVERGLLQHQTQGVDIDRIQLVRVEHGWIRRLFGYCKVTVGRIDSAVSSEKKNSQANIDVRRGMVVHPFLKTSELPNFIHQLLPEFEYQCETVCRPPAWTVRRAIIRNGFWKNGAFWFLLVAAVVVALELAFLKTTYPQYMDYALSIIMACWPIAAVFVIDIIVGVVRGVKWHKRSTLEYGNGFIHMTNEGFTGTEVTVPRHKVQFSHIKANPFQMAGNIRSALITTAAGQGGTTEHMWDLDRGEAEAFQEWLRPKK